MLNKSSKDFKKFFLLQFTRELIKNSESSAIFELKEIVKDKEESKELKQTIKKEILKREFLPLIQKELKEKKLKEFEIPKKIEINLKRGLLKKPLFRKPRVLKIPEIRLPQRLQYLKPTPTRTEIDLGKLNPLISDPLVKEIQCNGENDNVIVVGGMGIKPTNIILTKEEIRDILKKFSEVSKIPLHEGIVKIVAGRLILSAIISEVISSKFIIKKMMYSSNIIPQRE